MSNIPKSLPPNDRALVSDLLDEKPDDFTDLTKTQHQGFDQGVLDEGNHIVVAETGNGKTLLAEAVTKKSLEKGENIAYLVPSTALVGDKYDEIVEWAPDSINISKGGGYTRSDIVVATFESYYEAVFRGYGDRFDQVIFDDFHEIYGENRGPNIEKGISAALDQGSEIFAISATIGNPDVIADWMDARLTISTEKRAVPIQENPVEKTNESYATQITEIIQSNPEKGPYLVFCDTTSNAEARAKGIAADNNFNVPDDIDFEQKVKDNTSTELTDKHETIIQLLENGVAYHHGKLESDLKSLIEQFAENGVVKCITCTTSLSYGFDSPVQSVIVADLKRWDGYRQFIGIFEYVQMVGRAGRDSDKYDKAYAYPLYNDDQAEDRFQFNTTVENKELENVQSHLSGNETFRWLTLELINYGWETQDEILNFVSSTLFWTEFVEDGEDPTTTNKDKEKIIREIESTISWLEKRDIVTEVPTPHEMDMSEYRTTELGHSLVEFQHSNWLPNTVQEILDYANWIKEKHEDDMLTPEKFVDKLANMYYYCEESASFDNDNVYQQMDNYDLYDKSGETAALICWYWCSGASIKKVANNVGVDDLSTLPSTASNIASILNSTSKLFNPQTMPDEPNWFKTFEKQVKTGVAGPDTTLVSNTDGLGRARYNYIIDQLNDSREHDSGWDPGEDHYVIERLHSLYQHSDEIQFKDVLRGSTMVGSKTAEKVFETVSNWDNNHDKNTVPFENSVTKRVETASKRPEPDNDTTGRSQKDTSSDANDQQQSNSDTSTAEKMVKSNVDEMEYTSIEDFS